MPVTEEIPAQLIDLQTVVERTGLGYSTIRAYVSSGRLPAYRIGRRLRVAPADVEALFHRVKHPSSERN